MQQSQNPSSTTPGTINPVIGQIVSAFFAILGSLNALAPRFKRMNIFRNQAGKPSRSFKILYALPQALNVFLIVCLVIILFAALIGAFDIAGVFGSLPSTMRPPLSYVIIAARRIYQEGWAIVLIAALCYAMIVLDVFARLFVNLARALSVLPIPSVRGAFGPAGMSMGWHQAREFIRSQGDAQLFWPNHDLIEKLALHLFKKMATEPLEGTDRAATPAAVPVSERANIALFGCILESAESHLETTTHRWDIVYTALSEAHQTTGLLKPATVVGHDTTLSFGTRIRTAVNPILTSHDEPTLGLAIDSDLDKAAKVLRTHYRGDALNLAKGWYGRLFGEADALLRHARQFPRLDNDSMRLQFVKLCIRWETIAAPAPRHYLQPFAVDIGWLLLDGEPLGAASDQTSVTFKSPLEGPSVHIVAAAVLDRILTEMNENKSDESRDLRARYATVSEPLRSWLIRQEADTTMWRFARAQRREAATAEWKGHRWKLDNHTATRT